MLFAVAVSASAAEVRGREILVLTHIEPTRPAGVAFLGALQNGLDKELPGSNTLDAERVAGGGEKTGSTGPKQWFDAKYRNRKVDAIVTVGPANLEFALHAREEYWPRAKVFYLLLMPDTSSHIQARDATGVIGELSYFAIAQTAVDLLPDTQHIFLAGGGSPADRELNGHVIPQIKTTFPAITITDLTSLPVREMIARCGKLPPHSVIVIFGTFADIDGKAVTIPRFVQSLSAVANAPVFNNIDLGLGVGPVGGRLLSTTTIGEVLAHQMVKVLRGSDPNRVPEVVVRPELRFDARQLERWGISESRLPPGSKVEFRKATLWTEHRRLILGILTFVILQSALLAWLLFERRRRRLSQAARSASEQALRSQETLNQAVLHSLPGYVAILDRSGKILQVNETWRDASITVAGGFFAGTGAGDDYVSCWERGVGDADAPSGLLGQRVKSVLALERSQAVLEWRFPEPDSEARWLEIRCDTLQRPQGGAVISHVDITGRKGTELQAQQNMHTLSQFNRVAALGELAGALAHELNQPLASILVNAGTVEEMLAQESPPISEAREVMGEIISDDERAGQIIRKMRALLQDRESSGTELNLTEIVTSVVKLLASEAMLRKVVVRCELAIDLPPVVGDTVQLQQVVLNLMLNAMDAMRDCPEHARTVTVSTYLEHDEIVVLEVRDTGAGISPEYMPRLFDHFFTTKPDGLGLGLAISKSIVQALNGKIEAGNWQGGARFRVSMPVAAAVAPALRIRTAFA